MPVCLATETITLDPGSLPLNAAIPILTLVIGWFLKVLWDRRSQRTLFDHRLRLEKEYGLYSDLWEKLFKVRRALGQVVEQLGSTSNVRHDQQVLDLFNDYQLAVRKGEPFMSPSVFMPAREIATLARTIIENIGKQQSLDKLRERESNSDVKDKCTTDLIRLDEDSRAAFTKIDELTQSVAQAIRHRATP